MNSYRKGTYDSLFLVRLAVRQHKQHFSFSSSGLKPEVTENLSTANTQGASLKQG